jgi:hypothetical protein
VASTRVQQPPPNDGPSYDYGPEFAQDTVREIASGGTLAVLNASEIDRQIATAKHYPRQLSAFRKEAFDLIVQDEEAAAMCIYALPRGKEKNPETGAWEKKIVKGPSARFAEIIGYAWGNCKFGARTIGEEQDFVVAQGVFFDLEKNVSISYEVKRRIVNKDGERFNADMIGVTSNAACSIALRNAVLKGIPKALWKGMYTAAEKTIMGSVETLVDRRQRLIDLFKPFGLTAEHLCKLLEVGGVSDIRGDEIVTLNAILTSLRESETTVEQLMKTISDQDMSTAAKGARTVENIKNGYRADRQTNSTSAAKNGSAEAAAATPATENKNHPQEPQQAQENPDAEPPPEMAAAKTTAPQTSSPATKSQSGSATTSTSGSRTRGKDQRGLGDDKW